MLERYFLLGLAELLLIGAAVGQHEPARVSSVDDLPLDPRRDGWTSETFSELASQQLSLLAKSLPADGLADGPFRATRFFFPGDIDWQPAFSEARFEVHLFSSADARLPKASGDELVRLLIGTWQPGSLQATFKLIGVTLPTAAGDKTVRTRQLLSISGPATQTAVELHAVTVATWQWAAADAAPRLKTLAVESAERTTAWQVQPLFRDRTASVLNDVPVFHEQLVYGIDYWLERLEKMLTDQFGHHGLAVGDVNGDGFDDVYLCQPGGLPNLLLVQQSDGSVRNQAASAGVDLLDLSRSALLLDLDNDADQDLVVATSSHIVFLRNDGPLRFEVAAALPVRDVNSISAADYDNDGDLDIYACVYSGDGGVSRSSPTPIPIHDARNGGRNVMLRNEIRSADWEFVDDTTASGLDAHNTRWSYAAAWEDYDNDGDLDLYVANDFGRNNLYRRDAHGFVESSEELGLDEAAFGMSVSWADHDHDGRMDVYVSNMFSGAGNRVVPQAQFQPAADPALRQRLRYAARGNSLFRNLGSDGFQDISEAAGVTMGRWAWGSLFADINNDSWEDLLVGNGFVTREQAPDL